MIKTLGQRELKIAVTCDLFISDGSKVAEKIAFLFKVDKEDIYSKALELALKNPFDSYSSAPNTYLENMFRYAAKLIKKADKLNCSLYYNTTSGEETATEVSSMELLPDGSLVCSDNLDTVFEMESFYNKNYDIIDELIAHVDDSRNPLPTDILLIESHFKDFVFELKSYSAVLDTFRSFKKKRVTEEYTRVYKLA